MPFCRNCGFELLPEDKFCLNCGRSQGTQPTLQVTPIPSSSPARVPGSQVEYATLAQRVVAYLLDGLFLALVGIPLALIFFQMIPLERWSDPRYFLSMAWLGPYLMYLGLCIFLSQMYFVVLLTMKGQTFGKMAMRIKVVLEGGGPCDFGAALIRSLLLSFVDMPIFFIGVILIASSEKRQRLGDRLAKTIVVKLD